MKTHFSLILACYNEGPTFEKSIRQIAKVLNSLSKPWEIIFVEDKSTDETKKTVEKFVGPRTNSRVIYHFKNQGRGKSVTDGIKAARGGICGYLDVDLEVAPDYILLFINEIENGADMVVGQRFYEGGLKSLTRYIASKTYSQMVRVLLNIPLKDTEAGYKFFRRSKIVPLLTKVKSKHWFWDTEIMVRSYYKGLKIEIGVNKYDK